MRATGWSRGVKQWGACWEGELILEKHCSRGVGGLPERWAEWQEAARQDTREERKGGGAVITPAATH